MASQALPRGTGTFVVWHRSVLRSLANVHPFASCAHEARAGVANKGEKNHRSLSCSCPRSMRPPRNRNGAPPSPGTQQVVPWLLRSQLPDGRDAQFSAHHLRPPQGRDQISGRRKGKKRQAPCAQPCTSPSAEARRNPFCTRSFLVTGNPRGIWSLPSWVPRCSRMQICGGILPAAAHAPQLAAR